MPNESSPQVHNEVAEAWSKKVEKIRTSAQTEAEYLKKHPDARRARVHYSKGTVSTSVSKEAVVYIDHNEIVFFDANGNPIAAEKAIQRGPESWGEDIKPEEMMKVWAETRPTYQPFRMESLDGKRVYKLD